MDFSLTPKLSARGRNLFCPVGLPCLHSILTSGRWEVESGGHPSSCLNFTHNHSHCNAYTLPLTLAPRGMGKQPG